MFTWSLDRVNIRTRKAPEFVINKLRKYFAFDGFLKNMFLPIPYLSEIVFGIMTTFV